MFQETPENDLLKLLEKTHEGKSILSKFKTSGSLDNTDRNRLCRVIIQSELEPDPTKFIPSHNLVSWSRNIALIFNKEDPSTYYVPYYRANGIAKVAAGKLQDCYNYTKRSYRKKGIIPANSKSKPSSVTADDQRESIQHKLINSQDLDLTNGMYTKK